MGCFCQFCRCQKLPSPVTEDDIQRGSKTRELDAFRQNYKKEKSFNVIETWEWEWWRPYKTTNTVKQHIRENFPHRRSLAAQQLLEDIKTGKLFGYVQCDIEVAEILRLNFDNFPPIFKNTSVSKNDIGDLMKNYAEEIILFSTSENVDVQLSITKWNTYDSSDVVSSTTWSCLHKKHRFVGYIPKKCFNGFVQSAVVTRMQGDENPNSCVVAEARKLLASSIYGYHIM